MVHARRYTRTQIGQRVVLRLTPEIRYEYDDSLDQAEMVGCRAIGAVAEMIAARPVRQLDDCQQDRQSSKTK